REPLRSIILVPLPQMINSDLRSGASSTACGPCSPLPLIARNKLTSPCSSPSLSPWIRWRPLAYFPPLLTTTYRLSKAQRRPCASPILKGSFSTLVSAALPPRGGGVMRYKGPYWSETMSRPLGSTHMLTHEPSFPLGTE